MDIRVQDHPFDFGAEAESFARGQGDMGAVVTFTGIVRDVPDGLVSMEIEHYPGMTQKALEMHANEALTRFQLGDVLIVHRFGVMRPGEMIMMVATAAPHRANAFQGAEFLMDYLKSRAPFWKKEITRSGTEWVAARAVDEDALGRW
ncbi:molybdenum cofactor biosynthesis protein MoaE [Aquicoccus sp.]|uniref:molybdenum cofactor biosynthesis protein MoaE n=1 Tax=Aquicoccus sp. TaxID=2055851 RepID=UPI003561E197